MMTRKKRNLIVITIVLLIVLILVASFWYIYINTDLLKSNKTLFSKYLSKNLTNIEEIYKDLSYKSSDKQLSENKYETTGELKINYIQNIGTSAEKANNAINKLKLQINGKMDISSKYNYQTIKLLNDNQQEMQIEYIQNDDLYGIRFSELFNQFTLVRNSNLKELMNNLGISNEKITNMTEQIDFNKSLKEQIEFSETEKEEFLNNYISILNDIPETKFAKQKNQTVKLNNKDITANAYILTLTKEELNNLYIKFLEKIKEDDIILSKIDNLQNVLNQYDFIIETKQNNLKQNFTKMIEKTIENIQKNNIGSNETKIIVYENQKNVIKTTLNTNEYTIELISDLNEQEKYLELNFNDKSKENSNTITIKTTNEKTTINYQKEQGKEVKKINIEDYKKITNENNTERNITLKYENNTDKVEGVLKLNNKKVEKFNETLTLDDKNSLILNDYTKEQLNEVLSKMQLGINEKINNLKQRINFNDLVDVLKVVGLYNENPIIEQNRNI